VQLPLLLLITSITSLGNTFIPFLWSIVIAATTCCGVPNSA
jgi:hypothetical protein